MVTLFGTEQFQTTEVPEALQNLRGQYQGQYLTQETAERVREMYETKIRDLRNYYEQRESFYRVAGINFGNPSYKGAVDAVNEKIQKLEQDIVSFKKRLKGEHCMKSDFFRRDGTCREHDESRCTTCMQAYLNAKKNEDSQAITVVSSSLVHGNGDAQAEEMRLSAHHIMKRQMRFVTKALGMADSTIKKKKVKDLPKLLKEAEDEITIGGMEELLEEDNRDARGIVKGFLRFFLKMGKKR